ncbi:DUF2314 domain-containing protein [uncultured Erythrobacter sp.]|uniref:DUF2314 domain-containing protein n=1 Tax=uncultured Erythrobacter sp. TaxID=263913 RepID=UPI002631EF0D|nr:DUF2314 domain-containing protein [uncultured Erythrobacter sp.]
MRIHILAAFAALALALTANPAFAQPVTSERDDVERVESSDPEMNAAIETAQQTLPDFLAMLADPPRGVSQIGFKFPLGGWEHIWVHDVRRDGDYLTGRLSNVPMQEEWKQNERVRVPLSEVSDWAWMDADGVMRGQHTTRVLLSRIDPQMAAAIAESFGWKR